MTTQEYHKAYREANRERLLKLGRDYYYATREARLAASKKYREDNYDKHYGNRRLRDEKPENRIKTLVSQAKIRAQRKGFDFDITDKDVEVSMTCPLLGVEIDWILGKGQQPTGPSLDRIDPTKGYVKGNVWVVSKRANSIKNDATIMELELLTSKLKEKLNGTKVQSNIT